MAQQKTVVTILGAGAMGSGIATPFTDAGHTVRLWGTHLDDHLIDAVRAGGPHPRTNVHLAEGVTTYRAPDLAAALDGAEVVVIAIASVGVRDIATLAAPHLGGVRGILLLSKGFAADAKGVIQLLPQTVTAAIAPAGHGSIPIVAVGGPCKANEVAARQPTAPIFAVAQGAADWAALATTPAYRAASSPDCDGVEICAALKNVFAIALGAADGMGEAGDQPFHDLKAAFFAEALLELRLLLEAEGADPWTALGLAGAGDLEVTGLSGRNKVYGSRLGRGQSAKQALDEMVALEQTVEGVSAVKLVTTFVQQRQPQLAGSLPLLFAIHDVVHADAPLQTLLDAGLPA